MRLAVGFDDQRLAERRRLTRHQPQRFTSSADRQQADTARRSGCDYPRRPFPVISPHHNRAISIDDFGEQPQLGGEIGLHCAVIIEMIARQIGEAGSSDRQTFGTILVEPMA